jgi:hypothetical protein
VSTTPAAKLPPSLLAPLANIPSASLHKDLITNDVDTGSLFAAGINDTGDQLAVIVSGTGVVHLELRISSPMEMILLGMIGGLENGDI